MAQSLIWNWDAKFATNEEKPKSITNVPIIDLQECWNITTSAFSEWHGAIPPIPKQKTRKEAVYVECFNDQEYIIYKYKQMKPGRLYPITWNGNKLVLRKIKGKVQILEPVE